MRRLIIVMFCSLYCFSPESAEADSGTKARAQTQAEAQAQNRGALFKVASAGHTLYLFGTIHVGARDFYPLEPRVSAALARAGKLALEVDPLGDPALVRKALLQYGLYPAGGSALADIRPEFLPRLQRLLKRYALAPEAVAPMKPWLLASVLALSEFAALGYDSGMAVDTFLSQQAHQRRIPVIGLESVAGQMALFDRMTITEQGRFLEEGMDAIEDEDKASEARELVRAWRMADAAALDALASEAASDDSFSGKFVQKVLLDERNPGLAHGIARLLAGEKNSMAAIGVLHLVGAGSVPVLLRQRGLKVERVY